jgi:hypothetical protein
MGRWTMDSKNPDEWMDAGHFDTSVTGDSTMWIIEIGGKILGMSPDSPIVPKDTKEV